MSEQTNEDSPVLVFSKAGREPHEVRVAKLALPRLRQRHTEMRKTLAGLDAKKDRGRVSVLLRESLKLKNRMQWAEILGLRYHTSCVRSAIEEYEPLVDNDKAYEAAMDMLRDDLYESESNLEKLEQTTTECEIGDYDE